MKNRILESVKKFIDLYGIKRFTIEDISKDLKISKKTIYKHFESKDQLISEYLRISIEDMEKLTLEAVEKEDTFIKKIHKALYYYHKNEIPIRILEGIQRFYPNEWKYIEKKRKFKIELVQNLIKAGIESGEIRKDIHPEIVSIMLDKVTSSFLDYEFLKENNFSISQATDEFEKILFFGILEQNNYD